MAEALHAAFAAIDAYVAEHSDEPLASDLIQVAKAKGLIIGYDYCWSSSEWRIVDVKQRFELPIINPTSNRSSRTYKFAGEEDGIVAFGNTGKHYLLEHKTSSEDISTAEAPYWRRLEIDAQVSGYVLAEWQGGRKLDGTLYDVIRKPGIKPKQVTKDLAKEMQTAGTYYGVKVGVILSAGEIEQAEHYQHRLAFDAMENKDWYFARRAIYRMDSQVLEFANELWQTADEIRLAALNDRHFRNSGACLAYNRACEYLGICSGHDSPDSGKWARKSNVHEELDGIDGDGREFLTVSRMQCFRQCRRKHYYRYELGIKSDKEEAEALFFGSMMHAALAAWWTQQVPLTEVSHV